MNAKKHESGFFPRPSISMGKENENYGMIKVALTASGTNVVRYRVLA